ncbi:MAG: hypothetical protein ABI579_06060, partial [Candidatus Sumerlaeota bacterium]
MTTSEVKGQRLNHPLIAGLLCLAGIICTGGLWRALPDMVDDAYITFQCVKNLVHYGELTFNVGTRVEAFSNPLMAFLLAPLEVVRIPLPLAARLIGLLSFGVASYLVYTVIDKMRGDKLTATLGAACMLASFPFLYYSVTGLETGLFGALLTALAWRLIRGSCANVIDGLLVFAVLLCRPEAVLHVAFLFACVLVPSWKEKRATLIAWIWGGVAFLCVILVRKWYYGLWLPNPFYAKPAGNADLDPATTAVGAAFNYVLEFFWRCGFVVPLLALFGVAKNVREPAMRALGAIIVASFAFAVY